MPKKRRQPAATRLSLREQLALLTARWELIAAAWPEARPDAERILALLRDMSPPVSWLATMRDTTAQVEHRIVQRSAEAQEPADEPDEADIDEDDEEDECTPPAPDVVIAAYRRLVTKRPAAAFIVAEVIRRFIRGAEENEAQS
jgi:hypothetical protein